LVITLTLPSIALYIWAFSSAVRTTVSSLMMLCILFRR
jgi:hypothetical protein